MTHLKCISGYRVLNNVVFTEPTQITLSQLGSLQVPTSKALITTDFYKNAFGQGIQTILDHILLCIEDQRHHIYKKKHRKTNPEK